MTVAPAATLATVALLAAAPRREEQEEELEGARPGGASAEVEVLHPREEAAEEVH